MYCAPWRRSFWRLPCAKYILKGPHWTEAQSKFLIDTCHSDESTKNLARYLRKIKLPIYGICGILKNKNPDKLIKNFKGIFKKLVTFKIPEESNALSSFDLKKISERQGFKTLEAKNI